MLKRACKRLESYYAVLANTASAVSYSRSMSISASTQAFQTASELSKHEPPFLGAPVMYHLPRGCRQSILLYFNCLGFNLQSAQSTTVSTRQRAATLCTLLQGPGLSPLCIAEGCSEGYPCKAGAPGAGGIPQLLSCASNHAQSFLTYTLMLCSTRLSCSSVRAGCSDLSSPCTDAPHQTTRLM